MTSTCPWWFLDVDGVVNCLGVPKAKCGHAQQVDVTTLDNETYPICYFPVVIDRINALHRARLVHIVWLTSWNRSAPERFAPAVGLDEFPVLADPGSPDWSWHQWDQHRTWWKLGLVLEMVATDQERRVIWTDDDLDRRTKDALRAVHRAPLKLMTTMSVPGLTLEHLDVIEAFARATAPAGRSAS